MWNGSVFCLDWGVPWWQAILSACTLFMKQGVFEMPCHPGSHCKGNKCRLPRALLRCACFTVLAFLPCGFTIAAETEDPTREASPPISYDEFKPLSGLDNTPSGGSLPGGTLPGGTLPGGTLPGGTLPGGTVPGGMLPGGTLPGGTLPGGTLPGGTVPGGTLPGGTLPGGDL